MNSYKALLDHVMTSGKDRTDRTGVGTRSVFGYQWRHNMDEGFPLLTTKKVHFRSVAVELLWFLSGGTNIRPLLENGCTIWTEWPYKAYCEKSLSKPPLTQAEFEYEIVSNEAFAKNFGGLGPVYGYQWRHWAGFGGTVDQIADLIYALVHKPDSRRHIVSAWNPAEVPSMALPPCHTLWQCYVDEGKLSLHLYARSIDSFLGLPFNIASYGLLLTLLAHYTNYKPGELIISFGDLHIYKNHFEQVEELMSRQALPLPSLHIGTLPEDWRQLDPSMWIAFETFGYAPHPAIKAPIAV